MHLTKNPDFYGILNQNIPFLWKYHIIKLFENEDYGDDGDGSSCSGGECESDDYTDDDRPDWMK